jgi:arylsulfatase A-like enzyme
LLQNKTDQINQEIFAEATYHAAYEPQRAVRTTRWKYIRRFGDRRTPVLCNCDDSPSKTLFMQYGWKDRFIASEQLYDLIFDPNEACNLVNDPSLSTVLEEMRTRLDHWMRATDDPLLRGPVPAPAGAELNDPDQVSSHDPTRIV